MCIVVEVGVHICIAACNRSQHGMARPMRHLSIEVAEASAPCHDTPYVYAPPHVLGG